MKMGKPITFERPEILKSPMTPRQKKRQGQLAQMIVAKMLENGVIFIIDEEDDSLVIISAKLVQTIH